MTTLIIKSNAGTGSNVLVRDLGILIPPAGGSETFTDDANIARCQRSTDLFTLATDGAFGATSTLILNDGTSDIPPGSIGDFLVAVPPHAVSHQHVGYDEVSTTTPAANAIPKSGAGSTLAAGWLPAATESAQGAAEVATQGETDTGTDDARIVTPLKLATTPRLPSQSENDALQGTSGVPSNTNRYVTNDDARNTNARTPTSHAASHQHGGSDEVATATPAANAIPKADGVGLLDSWVTASQAATAEAEPTGVENAAATITISWSDVSKILTVAPTGASFNLWQRGVKYVKTTETKDISGVIAEGFWYFYYDTAGVLQASQTPWDYAATAQVALIYWDATNTKALAVWWEPHGITMDWATHKYLHTTVGARFWSGLSVSGSLVGDGSLDADAYVQVGSGAISDEDLEIVITNGLGSARFEQDLGVPATPTGAKIPVWYLDGATPVWRVKTANSFALLEGVNRIQYNLYSAPNWTTTEVSSNGNYTAVWLFATNNQSAPIIAILGQREDGILSDAEDNNTLDSLNLNGFPIQEAKVIARLIFQTAATYANAPHARLRGLLDLRVDAQLPSTGFVTVSHNSLSGRSAANAHPASSIQANTTAFNGWLTAAEDTTQKALDKLDDTGASHATQHKHGGTDEVATATPTANAIPKADGAGKLDTWVSDATTAVKGKVELATDGEIAASLAVQATDTRLAVAGKAAFTIGGKIDGLTLPYGDLASEIVPLSKTLTTLQGRRGVQGSAGTTTVVLELNGSPVGAATLSWASTDVAWTLKTVTFSQAVVSGDRLSIRLTSVETGGEDLVLEVN